MRLLRFAPLALLALVILVAAGCGGGSASVPNDSVAKVGSENITKTQFTFLMNGAKHQAAAAKATFPKPGTTEFKTLQDKAMAYLVQESELEQKGKSLGVEVTDKDVDKQIAQIKKQYFNGDQKTFDTQLKQQGFTLPLLKVYQRGNLLSAKLYKKVTSDVKVSSADIERYYITNKSQYVGLASRDVRHILVNSKKQADDLELQLKAGADFGKLAKKYSKDTSSAVNGGKLTVQKGKTVPQFDKEAFALKTNAVSPPVHTQYGWHIIQALSPVRPAATQSLSSVRNTIKTNLLQQKKTAAFQKWLDGVKKEFAKKIHYQAGYTPANTGTSATTTASTT
jgi:foldase protein PrsA